MPPLLHSMALGRVRGFLLAATDAPGGRAARRIYMKSEIIGIAFAVATSYSLLCIRRLLLTPGRNKNTTNPACLMWPVDDEAGPGGGDCLSNPPPGVSSSPGKGNHLRPPLSLATEHGNISVGKQSNGREVSREMKAV